MTQSPFRFLRPYEAKDKDLFFGRDHEIDLLSEFLLRSRFVVVYGPSGSGKTSLIRSGLAKKLHHTHWFPVYIRPRKDIMASCRDEIMKFYKPTQSPLITTDDITDAVLGPIKQVSRLYLRPVYLIFDQLEELFISGTPDERDQFSKFLKKIDESDIPCKVILSLREDYLAHLYQFEEHIPTLLDFRLRVEPLTNKSIKEVIKEMFKKMPEVALSDKKDNGREFEEEAEDNADYIIAQLYDAAQPIQLPYLQVYLDRLWNYTVSLFPAQSPVVISHATIEQVGRIESVLEKFLEERIQQIEQQIPELQSRQRYVLNLLSKFVTIEGTRRALHIKDIDENEDKPLKITILKELDTQRILQEENGFYELYHDSLAIIIFRSQSIEQKKASNLLLRIERFQEDFSQYNQKTNYFLDRLSVEEFKNNKNSAVFQALFYDLPKNKQDSLNEFVKKSNDYHEKKHQLQLFRFFFTATVLLLSTIAVWQWRNSSLNSLLLASTFLNDDIPDDALTLGYDAYQRPFHSLKAKRALLAAFYNHDTHTDSGPLTDTLYHEQHEVFLTKMLPRAVHSVSFSRSSRYILTVNQQKDTVTVWDSKQSNSHKNLVLLNSFPFIERVREASFSDKESIFFVTTTTNILFSFNLEGKQLSAISLNPNNKHFLNADNKGISAIDSLTLYNTQNHLYYHSQSPIRSLVTVNDKKKIYLAVMSADDTLRLLNQNMIVIEKKFNKNVRNVAFSPSADCIAIRTSNDLLKIWKQPFKKNAKLVSSQKGVKKVYFLNTNHLVVLGDTFVSIWDVKKESRLVTVAHDRIVKEAWVTKDKDSHYQIITLTENILHYWNEQGIHLCSIAPNNILTSIFIDPNGHWIAGVFKNKTRIWPMWPEIEKWLIKEEQEGFLKPENRITIKKKYQVDDFVWDRILRPIYLLFFRFLNV